MNDESEKRGRWSKRRLLTLLLLGIVAVLVIPFGVSRARSSDRRLRLIQLDNVGQLPPRRRALRIACYNIAHGRGLAASNGAGGTKQQRLERLDAIADQLRQMDADVVVLNEVDFDCSWSQHVDQAAYLAR
ncbi:MAG: endonuclease/exonuclease/phosphatase family protein, partial [Pirellulales bacterium]|nr:endonuclease/exonuclease/phosphatase family protein [Pirellulales bacterium]